MLNAVCHIPVTLNISFTKKTLELSEFTKTASFENSSLS